MSDEPANLIEDIFMQKVGIKYPFVRSGGVNEKYGIPFFPSLYLISPDGKILTVPQDREPSEEFIEENLKNVSLAPKMPADSRFDALRSMWEKRDHKRVSDYLERMLAQDKLDAELRTEFESQKATLQQRIDRQTARIAELGKGPDFGQAEEALQKIVKEWKGLPPADAAQLELTRFGKDPAIGKELAASRALTKLLEKNDATKASQRKKLADELQKLSKKYAGTFTATKAEQMRTSLLTTAGKDG